MSDYIKDMQSMFYSDRIGKVYGCFEVVKVEYDSELRKQCWTLRCQHCGLEKTTNEGRDYVKGKNKGNCTCRGRNWNKNRKSPVQKPLKEKVLKEKERKPLMSDSKQYSRWKGIKKRCYNKSDKDYKNYGARGIKMCPEWKDNFWAFESWANNSGYADGLTIDRIDNNGDYSPSNCRWRTIRQQNKNKRNILLIDGMTQPEYCKSKGVVLEHDIDKFRNGYEIEEIQSIIKERRYNKQLSELCKEKGVHLSFVKECLSNGYSLFEIFNGEIPKKRSGKKIEIDGVCKTMEEWCAHYDVLRPTVEYRIRKMNMTVKQALTSDKKTSGRPKK